MVFGLSTLDLAGWIALLAIAMLMLSLILGRGEQIPRSASSPPPWSLSRTIVSPERTASPSARTPSSPLSSSIISPDTPDPGSSVAYGHYLRALEYRNRGAYDQAIAELEKLLIHSPYYWKAYLALAQAQIKQGQPERAVETCNAALNIDPESADMYNIRGLAYLEQGLYQEAIRDFERALELDPNKVWAYNNLGLAYARLEEYDRAIDAFATAVHRNPQTALLYLNWGAALEKAGRFAEARTAYEAALKIDPNHEKARRGLARVTSSAVSFPIT